MLLPGVLPAMIRMPLATYTGMWQAPSHFMAARMPIFANGTLLFYVLAIGSFARSSQRGISWALLGAQRLTHNPRAKGMKNLYFVSLLALMCCSSMNAQEPHGSAQRDDSALKAQLLVQVDAFMHAWKRQDAGALKGTMAPEFLYVTSRA